MRFSKNKKCASAYGNYPCNVYLHNALRFIEQGEYDTAYSEICWALSKAGDELNDDEIRKWKRFDISGGMM